VGAVDHKKSGRFTQLKEGEIFGYGVDSSTGCFIDRSDARALDTVMGGRENFFEIILALAPETPPFRAGRRRGPSLVANVLSYNGRRCAAA